MNQRPTHAVRDRLHPFGADDPRALRPPLGRSEVRRRAGEDEPLDALGRLQRERHPDHPAERDSAERDALEPELVEEREQAVRERLDRARPLRERGRAVAGMVVGEDAEALGERGKLPLPQLLRRAERVRQHEDRRAFGAVEAVVEAHLRDLLVLGERAVDERLGRSEVAGRVEERRRARPR